MPASRVSPGAMPCVLFGAIGVLGAAPAVAQGTDPITVPFPASASVEALATTTFLGADADDELGLVVAPAGDVNGDGIGDLLMIDDRQTFQGRIDAGVVYLVYGTSERLATEITPAAMSPGQGVVIGGVEEFDNLQVARAAGDVNGDGFGDVVLGAPGANPNGVPGEGAAYIVFGGSALPDTIDLATLSAPDGVIIQFKDGPSAQLGTAVDGIGDFNGDGLDDVAVGAPFFDGNNGAAWVVYGSTSFGSTVIVDNVTAESAGVALAGEPVAGQAGAALAGAGDFNNDGIDDLLVGAPQTEFIGIMNAGKVFLVPGRPENDPIDLGSVSSNGGIEIQSVTNFEQFGGSLAGGGDINDDGIADIAVGGFQTGRVLVYFGDTDAPVNPELLTSDIDGINGFAIEGAMPSVPVTGTRGLSISGDINADGIDDLVIGSPGPNAVEGSPTAAYVVFGTPFNLGASRDVGDLLGVEGFSVRGTDGDNFGFSVSHVGDITGDGIDDFLAGAPKADAAGLAEAGRAYLIPGRIGQAWTPISGGLFTIALNWSSLKIPSAGSVAIEPDFGGVITAGPTPHLLDRLVMRAPRGIATLDLESASLFALTRPFTLEPSAALVGAGIFASDGAITVDGLLRPDGLSLLPSVLAIGTSGRVEVATGLIDADVTNAGVIDFDGLFNAPAVGDSSLDVIGTLDNGVDAELLFRSATAQLMATEGITNAGDISVTDSRANILGDLLIEGVPTEAGFDPLGALAISDASDVLITGDVINRGTVLLTADSELDILGSLSGNGVLGPGGPGTAGSVFVEDGVFPGFSPGIARFDGDLVLGAGAATTLEIGGTTPGTGHDQIVVAGALGASGTLRIELIDGFTPAPGDAFVLLRFGALIGSITVELDAQLAALGADTSTIDTDGTLRMPSACPADFNVDGSVNILDVVAFINTWNAQGPGSDFNDDSVINILDVVTFINTWNAGCP